MGEYSAMEIKREREGHVCMFSGTDIMSQTMCTACCDHCKRIGKQCITECNADSGLLESLHFICNCVAAPSADSSSARYI